MSCVTDNSSATTLEITGVPTAAISVSTDPEACIEYYENIPIVGTVLIDSLGLLLIDSTGAFLTDST